MRYPGKLDEEDALEEGEDFEPLDLRQMYEIADLCPCWDCLDDAFYDQMAEEICFYFDGEYKGLEEMMDAVEAYLSGKPDKETQIRMSIDRGKIPAEVKTLAKTIRTADTWDAVQDELATLCELAGLSAKWEVAEGEAFEDVAYAAADTLGVMLI